MIQVKVIPAALRLATPEGMEQNAAEKERQADGAEAWATAAQKLQIGIVGYAGIALFGVAGLLWLRRR